MLIPALATAATLLTTAPPPLPIALPPELVQVAELTAAEMLGASPRLRPWVHSVQRFTIGVGPKRPAARGEPPVETWLAVVQGSFEPAAFEASVRDAPAPPTAPPLSREFAGRRFHRVAVGLIPGEFYWIGVLDEGTVALGSEPLVRALAERYAKLRAGRRLPGARAPAAAPPRGPLGRYMARAAMVVAVLR